MNIRQQIYFDDILESLWSQAYGEILSIVKEQQHIGRTISVNCKEYGIIGIFVDDYSTLYFLDCYHTLRVAEDYSDYAMFGVYKVLFEYFYRVTGNDSPSRQ